jgi:16S rRNA (guanine527-N7)-methyltransferase
MMSPELWNTLALKAGLTLDPHQCEQLNSFLDLLLSANERMNLTRITERGQAEILHVADALTLLPHLPRQGHRLADVGSGGGIPGIILAVVRPDAQVVLIESTLKKADFLRSTAASLSLSNVTVEPVRAEGLACSAQRGSFDIAVARAVAPLGILVQWLLPLLKSGGLALAMKGPKATDELHQAQQAIMQLGGRNPVILPAELPGRPGHVIVKIPINSVRASPAKRPKPGRQ